MPSARSVFCLQSARTQSIFRSDVSARSPRRACRQTNRQPAFRTRRTRIHVFATHGQHRLGLTAAVPLSDLGRLSRLIRRCSIVGLCPWGVRPSDDAAVLMLAGCEGGCPGSSPPPNNASATAAFWSLSAVADGAVPVWPAA